MTRGAVTPAAIPAGEPRWLLPAAMIVLYLVWGSTYLATRAAVLSLPPYLMAGVRFLIAGSLLFAFLRLRGQPAPDLAGWRAALVSGGLLFVGGFGSLALALQSVSSSFAALGYASLPVWAALLGALFGRRPSGREWAGVGLGLAGVGLLGLEGNLQASLGGGALVLVSAASWALGSLWAGRLPLPPGAMAPAAQMLVGGALLCILGLAAGERIRPPLDPAALWAVAYLIVFGSLLGFGAFTYAITHARPALAMSYAFVNPLVAVALGVGLAGETVGPAGLAALVVVLSGVGLLAFARRVPPAVEVEGDR